MLKAFQLLGLCSHGALWNTVFNTKKSPCLTVHRDYVRLSSLLWVTEPVSANAGSISQVVVVLVQFPFYNLLLKLRIYNKAFEQKKKIKLYLRPKL